MTALNEHTALSTLRQDFLDTSTTSMPLAGLILWSIAGVAGLFLTPKLMAYSVAFGSGLIFPLALLIERLRGRNLMRGGKDNPLTGLFMQGIAMVVMLWPLVILGARAQPTFIVLGAAILAGLVWIPYGWAANDPAGLRHAIARALLCYAAFIWMPADLKASAICLAVVACYLYSLVTMRRPGGAHATQGRANVSV
ncbi:MAG: hypothetical protein JNK75_15355 [Betaproteobacteria bacterium]|nr:hypothetical protein [Betaproteobacteria bacterium]